MKAIISDIHGNLEALEAVLTDIVRHGVEKVYCLGDLVGYGPNPCECVDLAMQFNVVLLGNYDQAVFRDPTEWGTRSAYKSTRWATAQLEAPNPDRETAERRLNFLKERPSSHKEGDFLFVHGSARNPLNEYVFPEDIYNQQKMEQIFALVSRYCFQGHTHVPGIITEDLQHHSPEVLENVYRLDGRKTLCNVGSVGQPRDGDWRACYVLLDGMTIRFRRIEYDLDATVKKIRDIDDLDDFLGDRLGDGR